MVLTIQAKCRAFVATHCATYDASHDISHIDRVVLNAVKLLELSDPGVKSTVDENVLIAIASLHDSFDHKYLTTEEAVTKAKAEVSRFLSADCQFSSATIDLMFAVIDNMGFTAEVSNGSVELSPEVVTYLHIVQDADRLDAIGAIGVCRCLAFSGAFGRPIVTADAEHERRQRAAFAAGSLVPVATKGPSAIAHFYDKLVFLKDMLKTPAGKILGQKRHDYIVGFLDQFFEEIGE